MRWVCAALLCCGARSGLDTDGINDPSFDGSLDGDGGHSVPQHVRLFVAQNHATRGLMVWDDADRMAVSRDPDLFVNDTGEDGGTQGMRALAVLHDRLFVLRGGPKVAVFDGASTLGALGIPSASFATPVERADHAGQGIRADVSSDTFWILGSESAYMFEYASTMTSATPFKVKFTASCEPLLLAFPCLRDATTGGGRAFAVGGETVAVWADALTKSGAPAPSFQLPAHASSITSRDDRLYVALGEPARIQIWTNIASLSATSTPAVTLTNGLKEGDSPRGVSVENDTLVVCASDHCLVWASAGKLTADRAPDRVLTGLNAPVRGHVSRSGTIFVHDDRAVVIYSPNPSVSGVTVMRPDWVKGDPADIALVEW